MPKGFFLVIASQFISALADNALLLVAMARMQEIGMAAWWAPLLKFFFTLSYVVLAPWVGALADMVPKQRLMAWMNVLKVIGAALMLCGANPLMAYGLVGLAAAAYAPAKYGIVTERVPSAQLVAANGWIEVSIVCAVLLGAVTGGALISPQLAASGLAQWVHQVAQMVLQAPTAWATGLLLIVLLYAVAALLNMGIPPVAHHYEVAWENPLRMIRHFRAANLLLWRDRDGGLSLAVTTLFWGAGATLQFIVLHWAQQALGLSLDKAAYLQGVVAVGVVIGAALAGRWVRIEHAKRVLLVGMLMGLLTPCMTAVHSVTVAIPILVLIGASAGFFVVPMNALLQDRGCRILTAGRSIAVQGFNENLSVLAMISVYSALLSIDVPINWLIWGFGLLVAAVMGWLMFRDLRRGPSESIPIAAAVSGLDRDAGAR
jgi:MFS family permease